MSIYRKVIDKYGGQSKFARLSGLPVSTVGDCYHGKIKNSMAMLLFEILAIAPTGIIKAAAKRVAAKRGEK